MPARLTVLGSINMDLVVYTDRLPATGETLHGSSFQTFPGGKGANQAVAAARMGAEVRMLGKVGADAFGDELLQNLHANRINVRHVGRAKTATGTALITVDTAGRNTIVVVPGANAEVLPADLGGWLDDIVKSDGLIMQLEIPLETVLAAAVHARQHGVRVILNPSPYKPLPEGLLGLVDVLVLNETEAALISGGDVSSETGLEQAARTLLDAGAGWVVITLGAQGCLAVGSGSVIRAQGFAVQAVDTVAAGDAFTGALAVALATPELVEGARAEPVEALRIANAAGALAVTVRGAQPSLPTRQKVEEFLRNR